MHKLSLDGFELPTSHPLRLCNARVPDALVKEFATYDHDQTTGLVTVDVTIVDGRFEIIADNTECRSVDLGGRLLLPGFTDMHVHLDKAFTVQRTGLSREGLGDAIALSMRDAPNRTPEDLYERMNASLQRAYSHGTVALRTHLDSQSLPEDTPAWEIFATLARQWHGQMDLQAVSLAAIERVDEQEYQERCRQLARLNGVAGAFMAKGMATDQRLDRFFTTCDRFGLDADFHVDETLSPRADGLARIASSILRTGYGGKVVAGHCCSLGALESDEAARIIDLVAQAAIHVVSLPLTNLFLMDRCSGHTPLRRGITLVQELHAHGVPVSFASDNVQDAFYPYGDFDMLEILRHAVGLAHLEAELAEWIPSVFSRPAVAMGLGNHGHIAPGNPADAIIFEADGWGDLLSKPHSDRRILRAGKPIDNHPPLADKPKRETVRS